MPRTEASSSFDRDKLEKEVLDTVVALYTSSENEERDVSYVANELRISALKARKLLITASDRYHNLYYHSAIASQIQSLFRQGKTIN